MPDRGSYLAGIEPCCRCSASVVAFWASYFFVHLAHAASQAQLLTTFKTDGAGDADEALERALTEPGSIDFADVPLKDVVERIGRQFQIQVVLNTKALSDAGVNPDTPVTKRLENLPLESILRLILNDFDLDFTIRGQVLMITSRDDEEGHLQTRVYPVLDLVLSAAPDGKRNQPGMCDYDSLIDVIASTIAPQSWDAVGGPGSIEPFDNAKALVVSQTRDVHRQIENLLDALRRVKVYQGLPSLAAVKPSSRGRLLPEIAASVSRAGAATVKSWQFPQVYSPP